jgi:hypothetical protein
METIYRNQKNSYILQAILCNDQENINRYEQKQIAKGWENIHEAMQLKDILKNLLIRLNDNDLNVGEIFLRIITPLNQVINF